jgi:transketolase
MDPLLKLQQHGQSYWLDNLTRAMLTDGKLQQRVSERGLRGVTSNPAIFQKAIAGSHDYDAQIEQLVEAGCDTREVYEALVTADVRDACDVLRPVHEATDGLDGYVSLEVSPHLAHDARASTEEARRLHNRVDRPNLFIKIPGTTEGLAAIEELLFEGIPVNITLLFSIERYEAVAEAYMRALERRLAAGRSLREIASVASFFLSRIDVLVDRLLMHRINPLAEGAAERAAKRLLGRAAVANARLAYQRFQRIVGSERWRSLAAQGARVQRMLWASTSTKNPAYSDVMYVEPLIGPDTVNTMPEKTIAAFQDHGEVRATLEQERGAAQQVMDELEALGIDFHRVTGQLLDEGIQKFIDPYDILLDTLESYCRAFRNRRAVPALARTAKRLRREVLRMTTAAGSGHPTSCLSCAEIVAALFFHEMRWDPRDPALREVDRFVLSKGHAAPILWAVLSEAGAIDEDPLSLRRIDSTLEGHPTPRNPWVKVATGSLGQGLAAANGMALADRLDGLDARIYCLMGDGECSEGSVWEAAQFASLHRLDRLVAIVDVNGLGQTGNTPYRHDTRVFAQRFESFGWRAQVIDGHDPGALLGAFDAARRADRPTAIIARTEKGKGVSFLEGAQGWHGKALDEKQLVQALEELGEAGPALPVEPRRAGGSVPAGGAMLTGISVDEYAPGDKIATRKGFGNALRKLGEHNPDIVVLDADVGNSTYTALFAEHCPERFFQCYIAEQNMVGAALGLAVNGKLPFVGTFACFLTRAADFIRMAGHSRPRHLVICGSHAGISIGEDGPSQMGLEDLALFRSVLGSTVLYPCDAVSAERLTELAAATPGIVYIRTTRPATPVIYPLEAVFAVGGSMTLRRSERDVITLVAAGITVHEALLAHERLGGAGIASRVIDAYSVKPLDVATLTRAAQETGQLLVVEDHVAEGGLGEAVAGAVGYLAPVHRLAITAEPRSGSRAELLLRYGIDHQAIEQYVLELVDHRGAVPAAS